MTSGCSNKNGFAVTVCRTGAVLALLISLATAVFAQSFSFDRNLPAVSIAGPVGLARASSGTIYAVDRWHHRVVQFDADGNVVRAWGSFGSGNGQFVSPRGVAVDSSGNVYVADTGNDRIQKFTSTGAYLLKWGTVGSAAGQLNLPSGVAVDSSGNIHVVDSINCRVQKFTNTGTYVSQWGAYGDGANQLRYPAGIAIDASGTVFVADSGNDRIARRTSTGVFSYHGSTGTAVNQLDSPTAVAVDAAGNVFIADTNNHRVSKRTPDAVWTVFGGEGSGNGQMRAPEGVLIDSAGRLLVADTENHRIQRLTAAGAYDTAWGSFGTALGKWNAPSGVAVTATGNAYIADTGNHRIVIRMSTGGLSSFGTFGSGPSQLDSPTGVGVDANGVMAIADTGNHRIVVRKADGTVFSFGAFGTGNGQFVSPSGVAIGTDGKIYVADWGNHRVQVFGPTGAYDAQWGSQGSGSSDLSYPSAIAVDASHNVYVADTYNHRILKRTSGGVFTSLGVAGSDSGQFLYPTGVAVDSSGMLYVADSGNDRWVKCAFNGYFQSNGSTGIGDGQLSGPVGIGANADGFVAVSDSSNHRVALWAVDDPTLPTSVLTNSPARNAAGWNKTAVTVSISATANASGATVREIRYAVDMGTEQVVSGASAQFVMNTDGVHSIAYWAVDSRGKVEPTRYATVRIDMSSPSIAVSIASGVLYVDVNDALSGLASATYSVDGGPAQTYTGPVSLPSSAATVVATATDLAGNSAQDQADNVIAWLKTVVASPVTVTAGGTSTVAVTLLAAAPPGGLAFTVVSNSSAAAPPPSVTVPAGSTTATFPVGTNAVATDTSVQLTVSRGAESLSAGLVVVPPVPRSLAISPSTIIAGATASATLTLTGVAPSGGQVVQIASLDTSVATVPATVTVPAGVASVKFTVNTLPTSTDQAVLISARVDDVMLVTPVRVAAVIPKSITVSPTSVIGGGAIVGRVTLTRAAPAGGIVVNLRSTDAVATIPSSVVVPAGTTTASFPIATSGVALDRVVGVEGAVPGKVAFATFKVLASKLTFLSFPTAPVPGGSTIVGTVTLSGRAPAGGMRVRLRSSTTAAMVPATVVVPDGTNSATFVVITNTVLSDTVVPVSAVLNGDTRSATFKVLR